MNKLTKISKLISLVLRHKPEVLDIELDAHGWADTATLIERINATQPFDMAMLEEIVRTSDKQRFAFNADKTKIRANQGHSIPVDLELTPKQPPDMLWHGTGEKSVEGIREKGILPNGRQYVHLSADPETAGKVGSRHGKPVIFVIDAAAMARDGLTFYQSENGVWLTDEVPTRYFRCLVPWKGPEWFEPFRKKAESMKSSMSIARNSTDGWYLVQRLNTYFFQFEDDENGISLIGKNIFCLGEMDEYYFFSDGKHFYKTYIPQDWDPSYDRIRWERFDSFEAMIMKYGYDEGHEVPLELLPAVLLNIIRNRIPTDITCMFVYARKPDTDVAVRLDALYQYDAERRIPRGVKALRLTKLVGDAEVEYRPLTLGTQDEVFNWLADPAHQREVIALADALMNDVPPHSSDEA